MPRHYEPSSKREQRCTCASYSLSTWRLLIDYDYLWPFTSLPLDGTIDHVAKLLRSWRRLWAKVRIDGQRIAATTGHFVNAVDVARLNTTATRAAAWREIRSVPARRARNVVARPRDWIRSPFHRTKLRAHPLTVLLPDALDDWFLNAYSIDWLIELKSN